MCDNSYGVNMVESPASFYHAGRRVIWRDKLSHRGKARSEKVDISTPDHPRKYFSKIGSHTVWLQSYDITA